MMSHFLRVRTWSVVFVALHGCGYFGYEPLISRSSDASTSDSAADAATCSAASPADYCVSLPHLSSVPVIDGIVDCGLVPRPMTRQGWYSNGNVPIPSSATSRMAAAWHADGIYVYVEVDDASYYPATRMADLLYCGDSAEIYLDSDGSLGAAPLYDSPGTSQLLARSPESSAAAEHWGTVYRDKAIVKAWRTAGFGTWPRPGGYVLEAFVTADDMELVSWALASGGHVGLDVGVNVSTSDGSAGDCGTRMGQYFLRESSTMVDPCYGRPYCEPRAFCTPVLDP